MAKDLKKEVEVKSAGDCPWCAYEGVNPTDGSNHSKNDKAKVTDVGAGLLQCSECGKHWERAALGKPWTVELERGERWAREHRARQLNG